jgi:hypothetical protein
MTVKMFFAAAVMLAVASLTEANAACWSHVSSSNNATIYVDACSIAKDGIYKKVWIKNEYGSVQTTDDVPAKNYSKTMELDYFDCAKRQNAAVQGIYYGEDGGVVKSESIELRRVRFVDPPPGTVAEDLINFVCKKLRK